jgi:hypothetical protein
MPAAHGDHVSIAVEVADVLLAVEHPLILAALLAGAPRQPPS